MTRTQINLRSAPAYAALVKLAARLGHLTVGSAAHGDGSPRQLLLALARAYTAAPADETRLFEKMLAAYLEWGDEESGVKVSQKVSPAAATSETGDTAASDTAS